MDIKELIIPGYLNPYSRLFLFTLFIISIIIQIYLSLIIEVQLAKRLICEKNAKNDIGKVEDLQEDPFLKEHV